MGISTLKKRLFIVFKDKATIDLYTKENKHFSSMRIRDIMYE